MRSDIVFFVGLHEVARGCMGLHGVAWGCMGLQYLVEADVSNLILPLF